MHRITPGMTDTDKENTILANIAQLEAELAVINPKLEEILSSELYKKGKVDSSSIDEKDYMEFRELSLNYRDLIYEKESNISRIEHFRIALIKDPEERNAAFKRRNEKNSQKNEETLNKNSKKLQEHATAFSDAAQNLGMIINKNVAELIMTFTNIHNTPATRDSPSDSTDKNESSFNI